jgi:hypothetical protein
MNKKEDNPMMNRNMEKSQLKDNRSKEKKKKVGKRYKDRLVSAPIAQSISFTTRRPRISNDGLRYCVKHRELIAEIAGSVGFTVQSNFIINPGFATTFPWLSPIANQWEQYHFKELSFHYIGRCPTTFSGSIMLVPEYDILDADPTSKVQASTYLGAVEQSPWTNFSCRLESKALQPMGPKKYVRSGPVLGDLKTYDGGKFLVISQGQVDTAICGDLWVEYDLELYVPQSGSAQAGATSSSTVSMFLSTGQSVGVTSPLLFPVIVQNPLTVGQSSALFTPLPGVYRIDVCATSPNFNTQLAFRFNGTIPTYGTWTLNAGLTASFSTILSFNGTDTLDILNSASNTMLDASIIFTLV